VTVDGSLRIPLFPLHTVLFPGGMLPLRVFEQRYVAMTKACLRDDKPFGVCLIREGSEVAREGEAGPVVADIGTLARIATWDMPQLGILHVVARGEERFRIERLERQASGLVEADVVVMPSEPAARLTDAQAPLRSLLELVRGRVGAEHFPPGGDFDDASFVGYRLAEFLPLPLAVKQTMLEVSDAGVRLSVLQRFLTDQGVLGGSAG
jgi:Lon protease-like protein